MRLTGLALVSLLGCTHAALSSDSYEPVSSCSLNERCYGGTGDADKYVVIGVGAVIAGTIVIAAYRYFASDE